MDITYIELRAEGTKLTRKDDSRIVQGSRNNVKVRVEFDDKWNTELVTTVIFHTFFGSYSAILDLNHECFIPDVVLERENFSIGLFQDNLYKTNNVQMLAICAKGTSSSAIPAPSTDVYQQIIDLINSMGEVDEEVIAEAVQKYLEEHPIEGDFVTKEYVDTAIAEIELLPGPKGDTGEKGEDGQDGMSAYDIWLSLGNTGTQADFIASLRGERGQDGVKGDKGDTGAKGDAGADGKDGRGSYQVWLDNGNSGTEQDFLNSLKGKDGDDVVALEQANEYTDSMYQQATGYTDIKIAEVVGGAPEAMDTLYKLSEAIEDNSDLMNVLEDAIGTKADEVEFQAHNNNTTIHITSSERVKWDGYEQDIEGLHTSAIDGKQLVFLGDSYCTGEGWMYEEGTTEKRGWAYGIQQNNPNCECVNLGVSGATVTKDPNNLNLHKQSYVQIADYPQCDYIIIEGGINDARLDSPLGTILEGYDTSTADLTTYCGSLEHLISSFFYHFSTSGKIKKLGFVTPTFVTKIPQLERVVEATIKICNKWCVPCLDLYHIGGYNIDTNAVYTTFINESGHPNKLAYDICFTPKIEEWLKSGMISSVTDTQSIPITNDLLATISGTALDAVQGRILNEKTVNRGIYTGDLNEIPFENNKLTAYIAHDSCTNKPTDGYGLTETTYIVSATYATQVFTSLTHGTVWTRFKRETWRAWKQLSTDTIETGSISGALVPSKGYIDVPVNFTKVFSSVPKLFFSRVSNDNNVERATNITIITRDINTTGFIARIFNNYSAEVAIATNWIATNA